MGEDAKVEERCQEEGIRDILIVYKKLFIYYFKCHRVNDAKYCIRFAMF